MSRITAKGIRQQIDDLRSQLRRLENFNKRGFTPEKCSDDFNDEHDWTVIDSEHDWQNYYAALMECKKCGTRQWWEYQFKKTDEEDPWIDLRPEEPKEEEE